MTTAVRSNNPDIAQRMGLHIFGASTQEMKHHHDKWKPFICYKCGLLKYPTYRKKQMLVERVSINGKNVCRACYVKYHKKNRGK